jgi:hypothetical protein
VVSPDAIENGRRLPLRPNYRLLAFESFAPEDGAYHKTYLESFAVNYV